MAHLPAELYDAILAHLADDTPVLRACSTASRAFTHPAQARLFAHIVLHSPSLQTSRTAPRLRRVFTRAPHLALHVRYLEVAGRETPAFAFSAREDALMFCLPLMTRLRALRVGYRMDLRRECLLFPIQPSAAEAKEKEGPCLAHILANTLSLPTLEFVEFAHLPLEFLSHCQSLRALALQDPDSGDAVVREWLAARSSRGDQNYTSNIQYIPHPEFEIKFQRPVLTALRLDCTSTEVIEALLESGQSLDALQKLSLRGLSYTDTDALAGLATLFTACGDSLEELEIDEPKVRSFARVLYPSRASPAPPSLPWSALRALKSLRLNLAFPTSGSSSSNSSDFDSDADDDSDSEDGTFASSMSSSFTGSTASDDEQPTDGRSVAGHHLLFLAHVLASLSSAPSLSTSIPQTSHMTKNFSQNQTSIPIPSTLTTLTLQDHTPSGWDYPTADIYVSSWSRILTLLSSHARFPTFKTLVVDSKRSVTQKIQAQVLDAGCGVRVERVSEETGKEGWRVHERPFAVRLGPGQLPGKVGRSFLRTLFGYDWQASDI